MDAPVSRFPGNTLGGIQTILRYEVAAPANRNTAAVFLAWPTRPGALPQQVQFLDEKGSEIDRPLLDSDGADCVWQHVELFQSDGNVAVIVATRILSSAYFSPARRGPMIIRTYQLQQDGGPGRSALVFKGLGDDVRSRPVCTAGDVENAIAAAASDWRPSANSPH